MSRRKSTCKPNRPHLTCQTPSTITMQIHVFYAYDLAIAYTVQKPTWTVQRCWQEGYVSDRPLQVCSGSASRCRHHPLASLFKLKARGGGPGNT
jgi:hypothetical protein